MGQIVIDIPANKKRRYVLRDAESVARLLSDLEASATPVKSDNPEITDEELEEIYDIATSTKALREIAKSGKVYPWESVKRELGI